MAVSSEANLIRMACSAKVFKQTSVFTVTSAAANNASLLADDMLGPEEDIMDCFDSDGLLASSYDNQWDDWSNHCDSDEALSRQKRDRCMADATPGMCKQDMYRQARC